MFFEEVLQESKNFFREVPKMRLLQGMVITTSLLFSAGIGATEALSQEAPSSPEETVSYIENVISTGTTSLEKARQASDVSKADCINVHLINAKGYLNIAQANAVNIQDAQSRNDAESVAHYQKLLDLAGSKTMEIDALIKQCSEGVIQYSGDTTLKTTYTCEYPPCVKDDTTPDTEISKIEDSATSSPAASPYP